jgi:ACR3 family arsenite efflux pump ArsB
MGGRFDAIAKPGEKRGLGLATSLFGFDSGAALATVVGVLVEVPVMLSVVAIVMRSKAWYQRA